MDRNIYSFIKDVVKSINEKIEKNYEKITNSQSKLEDKLYRQIDKELSNVKKEMLLDLKNKPDMQDLSAYIMKMIDKVKAYHIKDGYWYFEEKKLCKAEAKDGKNGLNGKNGIDGKDGRNGLDGKNGLNGKDGKDGRNGKDGRDGTDGKTPIFEIVEIETITSSEEADVQVEREGNTYKLRMKIPRGAAGHNGPRGQDGTNGIVAIEEITLEEWELRKTAGTLDANTIYYESLVI